MILASQLGLVWAHKGSKLVLLVIYNNFMLIDFGGKQKNGMLEPLFSSGTTTPLTFQFPSGRRACNSDFCSFVM